MGGGDNMKKIVSIIMVMMMVLTPMATSEVSAAEYSTYDIDGYNKISILTISSNTATCKSRFLGATDVM